MKLKLVKKGFNYSQDGRGNRLVYHLQGCNFACPWCSNPETVSREACRMRDPRGFCRESCVDVEVGTLAEEAESARPLFFDGGGVTLTGGEPTLQFEGVSELFARLKAGGIHTAMETNASHPRLAELFPLVDQLMADFKHYDDGRHREVIGCSNREVMRNLARALAGHPDLRIRTLLVRGFNDSEEDLEGFLRAVGEMSKKPVGAEFEFLAYHEYGRVKWEQIGRVYAVEDGFVPEERVERFRNAFRAAGYRVVQS